MAGWRCRRPLIGIARSKALPEARVCCQSGAATHGLKPVGPAEASRISRNIRHGCVLMTRTRPGCRAGSIGVLAGHVPIHCLRQRLRPATYPLQSRRRECGPPCGLCAHRDGGRLIMLIHNDAVTTLLQLSSAACVMPCISRSLLTSREHGGARAPFHSRRAIRLEHTTTRDIHTEDTVIFPSQPFNIERLP